VKPGKHKDTKKCFVLHHTVNQRFPKSGLRTIVGLQGQKKISKFCIFNQLIVQIVNFAKQMFFIWSAELISEILWSAKFFSINYGPQA
jgi:hypothetical protein